MLGNAFLLSFRQILRNPMRSLLTVLGVVIGVAAVIIMVTLGNGATTAVRTQIENFGNNQLLLRPGQRMGPGGASGAPYFKVSDAQALVEQVDGIVSVAPQRESAASVVAEGRNWMTTILGTTSDYFKTNRRSLSQGRIFEKAEEVAGSAVCVIGNTVAREIYTDAVAAQGKMLRVKGFSCRVIGVLEEKGTGSMGGDPDDLVILPFNTVSRRLVGQPRPASLLIAFDPECDREQLKASVRSLMRERRSLSAVDADNFMILDTAEIAETVASTTRILTTLLGAVAAVSLLVGGIGIMNIMLVSVTERTREIGVRLAIGATAREVLLQFLIEAVVLGCLGGILGVLIAFGASWGLSAVMSIPFEFNLTINVVAFAFSALTGIVFGFFPARNAARLDPIEAVRHE